jgi:single-strand DNA-binding protein
MPSLNRVFLIGNLTRDPEVRYTPSGKAVSDLRMAVNRRFTTPDGQTRDETCFVNVVVWGRSAELAGERLTKGMPLFVEGRLQYEEWEKDGQKFSRLRVVGERIQFLTPPRGGETHGDGDEGEGRAPQRPKAPVARREAGAQSADADEATTQAAADDRKNEEDLPF